MSAQFDTTSGQPGEQPVEELTTQDIVSSGRSREAERETRQARGNAVRKPDASPAQASGQAAGQQRQGEASPAPLLSTDAAGAFQTRWEAIQTAFVDEPRRAVEQADGLVAAVMQQLADTFAKERAGLERQWTRGEDVSTEELRLALQRYRSFFQRLLSA